MINTWQIVLLVVGIVGTLMLASVLVLGKVRKVGRSKRDALLARVGEHNLLRFEPAANCFGRKSLGLAQVRGNGCWALTADRIVFDYWVGGKDFEIPLSNVTATRTGKSFLGKTKGHPLLIVEYTNESGQADEAAWLLADVDSAKAEVDQRRG
ncbi:MAG: hypothetical protein P9M14_08965 [Candidatus Alcyoniella australis]|nr:hypothetical protein [Candidatus Alcyoniella australis]